VEGVAFLHYIITLEVIVTENKTCLLLLHCYNWKESLVIRENLQEPQVTVYLRLFNTVECPYFYNSSVWERERQHEIGGRDFYAISM